MEKGIDDKRVTAVEELLHAVEESNKKQKRLKSSTFWEIFKVGARQPSTVEEIKRLLDERNIKVEVKSEKENVAFGKESPDDWIILSRIIRQDGKVIDVKWPPLEWFDKMQTRDYESEREVETYFIAPLLEKLGYNYDDVVIGYKLVMYKGSRPVKTEADIVLFNGPKRNPEDVLLVIEAKNSNKDITHEHIKEARSYATELMPAYYVITNAREIKVFQYNGSLAPDALVVDFRESNLSQNWDELYRHICKDATVERKQWMLKRMLSLHTPPT